MLSSATAREESLAQETVLTVEAAAYVAICLLSLGLRLLALGAAPLSPDEARQALAAFHLAQGSPTAAQATGAAAPALLALQTLAFSLFHAGDSMARLPVLLATALSPLAFWFLRPVLGRHRSLLAALLLTLSPFWTTTGSMALGRGLAGAALLFSAGFAVRHTLGGGHAWAVAAGVALSVALGSSSDAWAAVALGLIIWLGLSRRLPQPFHWKRFGLGLGAGAVLISTVGLAHPAGLQSLLDLGGALVASLFRRQPGVLARQVLVLIVYEPLLLLPALGLMALVPPRDQLEKALYLWVGGSLLLTLLAGTAGMGLVLALPGMAVLAAEGIQRTGCRLASLEGRLRLEASAVAAVLLGYAAVALTGLAQQGDTVFLLLLLTAAGIGLALLGLLWTRSGMEAAITIAAAAVLAVLSLWSLANAAQAVTLRQMLPQEALHGDVSTASIADLVGDVTDVSWSRTGYGNELALTAEQSVGPVVAWYLRDLRSLTWVDMVAGETDAPALLTAGTELALSSGSYLGQDYPVAASWQPGFADVGSFLRWLLYRDVPVSDMEWHRVSLWVRSEGG